MRVKWRQRESRVPHLLLCNLSFNSKVELWNSNQGDPYKWILLHFSWNAWRWVTPKLVDANIACIDLKMQWTRKMGKFLKLPGLSTIIKLSFQVVLDHRIARWANFQRDSLHRCIKVTGRGDGHGQWVRSPNMRGELRNEGRCPTAHRFAHAVNQKSRS